MVLDISPEGFLEDLLSHITCNEMYIYIYIMCDVIIFYLYSEDNASRCKCPSTPLYKDWLIINQPSGQYICVNYVFCVVFDCWMTPDGRWCSQMIFGRPNIARVMQLLADGARLRVVARIPYFPPSIVGRLWRSYQETGE